MKQLNLENVRQYVQDHINTFHEKRLEKLQGLKLSKVLKRKNPYLFKAKHILTSEQLVRGILDAYLSSQEETLFGDFLEGLAVYIGQQVHDGYKPSTSDFEGLDLIFEQADQVYMVEIKSGPHWGNSSQIQKMLLNFSKARAMLSANYPNKTIIAVNGCCYGKDKTHSKKDGRYWKLCGQDFWRFVSGDDELYLKLVEPLSHQAKERNEQFDQSYAKIINRFTLEFTQQFCDADGAIDWDKLIKITSQRDPQSTYPFK